VAAAVAAVGASDAELATDASLRAALVDACAAVLLQDASLVLRDFERAFLAEAVELYIKHNVSYAADDKHPYAGQESYPPRPLGRYGVQRALGSIVSARAKLGWSTWGHTAADVRVDAFGPGADAFDGVVENVDIGARVARLLGLDLPAATAALGRPLLSEVDRGAEWGAYASWPPYAVRDVTGHDYVADAPRR